MTTTRRRASRFVAAAAALSLALGSPATAAEQLPEPTWTQTSPIPPAVYGVGTTAAWDGHEFLVFAGAMFHPGGCTDRPCEYPFLRFPTAMAFAPESGRWRKLADLPETVDTYSTATSRGITYVLGRTKPTVVGEPAVLQAYDREADKWSAVPLPPNGGGRLLDAGGRLVSVGRSWNGSTVTDAVYDDETGVWNELPPDPFGPGAGRSAVWTGDRLVLASAIAPAHDDGNSPRYLRLASLDLERGVWTTIAKTRLFSSEPPQVFGSVLVWPDSSVCVCGKHKLRAGGTFDPVSRTWRDVPDVPHGDDPQSVWAAGGEFVLKYGGTHELHPSFRQEYAANEAYLLTARRSLADGRG